MENIKVTDGVIKATTERVLTDKDAQDMRNDLLETIERLDAQIESFNEEKIEVQVQVAQIDKAISDKAIGEVKINVK